MDFSIANFKGPLPLLVYLIQKEEMDVFDVTLKELTTQFLSDIELEESDFKAEFISLISWLLLLKSRRLLPTAHTPAELEEENVVRMELIHKLLEYTSFKGIADTLLKKEMEESSYYARTPLALEKREKFGLEEVAIDDLNTILQELLEKVQSRAPKVLTFDEQWDMTSVVETLKTTLVTKQQVLFEDIFSTTKSRGELIALFLALLELMKQQVITLTKQESKLWILKKPSP